MSHEITLAQAAEMARQAEIVCALIENHPHKLTDCEISALAALIKRLAGSAASWLITEESIRGGL